MTTTTPVDVGAQGRSPELATTVRASKAAIEAIKNLEQLMSFPAEGGDISLFNLEIFRQWVANWDPSAWSNNLAATDDTFQEIFDKVNALVLRESWVDAGFSGNLAPGDNTLQEVFDKLDALVVGGGGSDIVRIASGGGFITYQPVGANPAPSLATGAGTATLTPNSNIILAVEFTSTTDGSGVMTFTHGLGQRSPNFVAYRVSTGNRDGAANSNDGTVGVLIMNGMSATQSHRFNVNF